MGNLFGKKAEAPTHEDVFPQARLYTWLKALEIKVNKLNREFDLLKNESIRRTNNMKKEVKHMAVELLEIKDRQEKSEEKLNLIIKELKQTAGLEELMVIKKYMEYWNPLEFVTQKDLERMVENKIHEAKHGKHKETKVHKIGEKHQPYG